MDNYATQLMAFFFFFKFYYRFVKVKYIVKTNYWKRG